MCIDAKVVLLSLSAPLNILRTDPDLGTERQVKKKKVIESKKY